MEGKTNSDAASFLGIANEQPPPLPTPAPFWLCRIILVIKVVKNSVTMKGSPVLSNRYISSVLLSNRCGSDPIYQFYPTDAVLLFHFTSSSQQMPFFCSNLPVLSNRCRSFVPIDQFYPTDSVLLFHFTSSIPQILFFCSNWPVLSNRCRSSVLLY